MWPLEPDVTQGAGLGGLLVSMPATPRQRNMAPVSAAAVYHRFRCCPENASFSSSFFTLHCRPDSVAGITKEWLYPAATPWSSCLRPRACVTACAGHALVLVIPEHSQRLWLCAMVPPGSTSSAVPRKAPRGAA